MKNMFAERLTDLLIEKSISKRNLAVKLNVSAQSVSDWSTGKVQPTAENIYIVAKYFNVTSDYLLGLEDEFGQKEYSDEFSYSDGTHNITHKRNKK